MISSVFIDSNKYIRILDPLDLQVVDEEITYGYKYLIQFRNMSENTPDTYGCYDSLNNTRTPFDQDTNDRVKKLLPKVVGDYNEAKRAAKSKKYPATEHTGDTFNVGDPFVPYEFWKEKSAYEYYVDALNYKYEFPRGKITEVCVEADGTSVIQGHYHKSDTYCLSFTSQIRQVEKEETFYQHEGHFVFKYGDQYFCINTDLEEESGTCAGCKEPLNTDDIHLDSGVPKIVHHLALIAATLDI